MVWSKEAGLNACDRNQTHTHTHTQLCGLSFREIGRWHFDLICVRVAFSCEITTLNTVASWFQKKKTKCFFYIFNIRRTFERIFKWFKRKLWIMKAMIDFSIWSRPNCLSKYSLDGAFSKFIAYKTKHFDTIECEINENYLKELRKMILTIFNWDWKTVINWIFGV